MSGFIYVWRDRKRNMYYVGCHWGTETDGYVCSSTWMRNAYSRRQEDFSRKIVSRICSSRNDLLIEEYRWLQMISDDQLGKKFYNLTKHLNGHWTTGEGRRLSISEKISKKTKEAMARPEVRAKVDAHYATLRGKQQDSDVVDKRRDSMTAAMAKKFPVETRSCFGASEFGSPEYCQKMAISVKESWTKKDRVAIGAKISESLNSSKQTRSVYMSTLRWYNDGSINKRLADHPGTGWSIGRMRV